MARRRLCLVVVLAAAFLQPAGAAERIADECGLASVYSTASGMTASGEHTRVGELTAAHRSLQFGTMVTVDNRANGRSAVVRITDRGPFIAGRIIDVSQMAALKLGISGLTQVCLNIIPASRRP